jgi:hypothetical protein
MTAAYFFFFFFFFFFKTRIMPTSLAMVVLLAPGQVLARVSSTAIL